MKPSTLGALAVALFAPVACASPDAPRPADSDHKMHAPRLPGGCEAPFAGNEGKKGCYFDVAIELGTLPETVFWHVYEFPDRRRANSARGSDGAVVSAYGRTFLHTVNAVRGWRAAGGRHLATVGPMPAPRETPVTARFMQAMTDPGAATRPHRHPGAEAFYLLSGAICMESPGGAETTGAGETYWIRGGVPMQLTSAGTGLRRSLFLVLHPSSQPWMTPAEGWVPTGACRQAG